jgi:hypothetical protein
MPRLRFILLAAFAACSPFAATNSDVDVGDAGDAGNAGTDANVNGDAATIGAADAGLDASPFCPQHPDATFCADFDEVNDVTSGWGSFARSANPLADSGGLDPISVSPPASALLVVPADAGACAYSELRKSGLASLKKLRASFDVYVSKPKMANTIEADFVYLPFQNSCALALGTGTTLNFIVQKDSSGNPASNVQIGAPLAPETWTHFEILVDTATTNVTITRDGANAFGPNPLSGFYTCLTTNSAGFYVGPHCVSPPQPNDVALRFDNVLVDEAP